MTIIQFPAIVSDLAEARRGQKITGKRTAQHAVFKAARAKAPTGPIFATIERYVTADAASNLLLHEEPTALNAAAHKRWECINRSIQNEYLKAQIELLQTPPTTRIGAAALIDFVMSERSYNGEVDSTDATMLLETLRDALPQLA